MNHILRFLRGLFGFRLLRKQTGHDRAERRERNWYPELWGFVSNVHDWRARMKMLTASIEPPMWR
jgi:hypothetical protein